MILYLISCVDAHNFVAGRSVRQSAKLCPPLCKSSAIKAGFMAAKGGGSVDLCGINIRTSPHSTEASATSRTDRLESKIFREMKECS